MTTVKQLYSLQELDQALDRVLAQKAEVEQELDSRLELEQVETALKSEREGLEEAQRQRQALQLEVGSMRERSGQLDARLYGGDITNPRELPSLDEESKRAKEQLQQQETALQALSDRAQAHQAKCTALEQELATAQTAWQQRQDQLKGMLDKLATEQANLAAGRARMAAGLAPAELHNYETLRRRKGGQAVSKVERGLCQACRMSLPTQHLQRVRSGRQTVFCSSCGRMLFLG
ncbi:MAG: hypothetical protein FJ316_09230 [SAR202 cluster bacterium]|nr:hypothetical protein [SAR202 cluster bacterium]